MKFIVFYPTDATQPMSPAVLKDSENLREFINQRIPTIVSEDLTYDIRQAVRGPHLLFTVTYPKSTRKEVRYRFRALLVDEKPSYYWGAYLDLSVPRDGAQPIAITHSKSTGSASQIPTENFNHQLNILHKTIEALFVEGPDETLTEADVRTQNRADEIHGLFAALAKDARKTDAARIKSKKAKTDQRAQILSDLPDGTPLAIRNGINGRKWQLGIKRGDVPKALANNAHVVTSDTLSKDAFATAGLSRHKVLIMGALAQKVLSDNPDLSRFPGKGGNWPGKWSLDEKTPFHESFYDPRETKERRRNMDVVWIQTGSPYRSSSFFMNDRPDFKRLHWKSTVNPNFPGTGDPPSILSMTRAAEPKDPVDLLDFEEICGIMTVSARAADVLRKHNMGRNELKPLMMVDENNCHMEGRYIPVIREVHSSIIMSRLPSDLHRSLGMRGVKDFEVPISGDAHGDIDLWSDSHLSTQPLMLSGSLVRALKKAKLTLPSALKRADIF